MAEATHPCTRSLFKLHPAIPTNWHHRVAAHSDTSTKEAFSQFSRCPFAPRNYSGKDNSLARGLYSSRHLQLFMLELLGNCLIWPCSTGCVFIQYKYVVGSLSFPMSCMDFVPAVAFSLSNHLHSTLAHVDIFTTQYLRLQPISQ